MLCLFSRKPNSAMRSRGRKRGRGFFCIGGGAAVGEGDMEEARRRSGDPPGGRDESSMAERVSRRRRSSPPGLVKIFRLLALLSYPSRSGKAKRDSNRLLVQKEAESMGNSTHIDDDRRALALFSSSSSSCFSPSFSSTSSSMFSSSSSYLLPSVSRSPETKEQLKMVAAEAKKPHPPALPQTGNYRSATWVVLFLISLTLLVFYGRLCAILWISSWFCYAARRNRAAAAIQDSPTATAVSEIKRKWEEKSDDGGL